MTTTARTAVATLGVLVAAMWIIEIVDLVFLDEGLDRHGIFPRRLDGVDGVLWAPLLHGGLGHVASNSVPLVVLGVLVFTEGVPRWWSVTAAVALIGGALTWLFARPALHIGASGIVFGYMGYLLAAASGSRKLRSIAIALGVGLGCGGALLFGRIPRPGVSWEGPLFGLVAGGATAAVIHRVEERPDQLQAR